MQPPAVEELLDALGCTGTDNHHHALLALGEHDLIGGHAGLAPGHLRDVQLDTAVAPGCRLDRRAGQPGSAEVLDADNVRVLGCFQAGFDQ